MISAERVGSETLLQQAEADAHTALADSPVEEQLHIAAWRDAYRFFGAEPQRTRNSAEVLLRRAATGLPRVNRLSDLYNAVSVLFEIPFGGEDLSVYDGPPRLVRAAGDEVFDTSAGGEPATEHPEPGRSRLARRHSGDVPSVELAAGTPNATHRADHAVIVHLRHP